MSELLSQRQFAQKIGRSHVWVSKLVKAGKLPTGAGGKIPLEEGLRAFESSQRVGYDANREHGESQRKAATKSKAPAAQEAKPAKAKAQAAVHVPSLPEDSEESVLPPGGVVSADRVNAAFNRARLAEKTYQAKLKELEYKEAQGLMLSRDEIESDGARTGSEIREKLGSVAPRVAAICEGKTAREIERIVDDAINDALMALQKSRFGKG